MEKINPRDLFVNKVLAAARRTRDELMMTCVGWFVHEDVTYRVEAMESLEGFVLSATGSDGGFAYRTEVPTTESDLTLAAQDMWRALAVHSSMVRGVQVQPDATCEGGWATCKADAVWAFRNDIQDVWSYACGRHLTAALTYDSDGEQAEFTVRRIRTKEK